MRFPSVARGHRPKPLKPVVPPAREEWPERGGAAGDLRTGRRRTVPLALLMVVALVSTARAERPPLRAYTTADGLPHDSINRIVRDSKGFLWFCTADGLARFDGYRFRTYAQDHGLPHRNINDLLETRSGTYLVATSDGLSVFNPLGKPYRWDVRQSRLEQTSTEPPLFQTFVPSGPRRRSRTILALAEDAGGRIWAGTAAGLFQVERRGDDWSFRENRPRRLDPAGDRGAGAARGRVGRSARGIGHRVVPRLVERRRPPPPDRGGRIALPRSGRPALGRRCPPADGLRHGRRRAQGRACVFGARRPAAPRHTLLRAADRQRAALCRVRVRLCRARAGRHGIRAGNPDLRTREDQRARRGRGRRAVDWHRHQRRVEAGAERLHDVRRAGRPLAVRRDHVRSSGPRRRRVPGLASQQAVPPGRRPLRERAAVRPGDAELGLALSRPPVARWRVVDSRRRRPASGPARRPVRRFSRARRQPACTRWPTACSPTRCSCSSRIPAATSGSA